MVGRLRTEFVGRENRVRIRLEYRSGPSRGGDQSGITRRPVDWMSPAS